MENNNHQDGKFFNGFLLGFVVGAAVVFLLATKRGKKLLKRISEGGLENINDFLDKVDKEDSLEEVIEEDEEEIAPPKIIAESPIEEFKPKAKRLFRGIPRRVN